MTVGSCEYSGIRVSISIGFFVSIMGLIFLYPLLKEATKEGFSFLFNRTIVSFQELYMALSKNLLKASSIEDILTIGRNFVGNIEGLTYVMQIQLAEGAEFYSGELNIKNIQSLHFVISQKK